MSRDLHPTQAWNAGITLVGLGILLACRQVWPGVLFLGGAVLLLQASHRSEHSPSRGRAGLLLILLGVWVLTRYSVPVLLIGAGAWLLWRGLAAAPSVGGSKPVMDHTLD